MTVTERRIIHDWCQSYIYRRTDIPDWVMTDHQSYPPERRADICSKSAHRPPQSKFQTCPAKSILNRLGRANMILKAQSKVFTMVMSFI